MRILHLISYSLFSGPMPGTLGLIGAQSRQGHHVTLAFDRVRGALDGYEEALTEGHFPPNVHGWNAVHLSPKANIFHQARDLLRLRKRLRQKEFDVVHCHLSHDHAMACLSKTHNIPLVRTLHDLRSLQRRFSWPLFRADAHIVRAAGDLHHLRRSGSAKPETCFYIPGGVATHAAHEKSPARSQRSSFRSQYKIAPGSPLILHCALMSGRGQRELIEAIAGLESAHLVLAGQGPEKASLRALASELGAAERVTFLGYVPFPNLSDAYQAADLAVVVQVGSDRSGRAALEALDFGLPVVVVPDAGALGDLAREGAAYASPSRSPPHLRQSIIEALATSTTKRKQLAHWRQQNSFRFGFAHEARLTDAVYTSVLTRRTHMA